MSLVSIKVFVSSPGDVGAERLIAKRILDRLAGEFAPVAKIRPIFWEHEPLLASESFQEQIPLPSQTDIVVCILWARIGTRLPREFTNADGTPRYKTGTEFEFEDALEGRRQHGAPDLLVYRKTAEPLVSLKDPQATMQAAQQKILLDQFVDGFFHGEGGTLIAAFQPFDSAADFETRLEEHLRKLILGRLQKLGVDLAHHEEVAPPTWNKGSPFRGLAVFEYEHHDIFFGRTRAIGDVIERLKRQAAEGRAFLLVLGTSGCGKSSLIRAGVLPILVQPAVVEGVGLWRRAVLRPIERSGDLFDGLATALLAKDALPELAGDGTTAAKLAGDLRANPSAAHLLLRGYLSKAAGSLAKAKDSPVEPAARLVLVLDQLEELFTAGDLSPKDLVAFFEAVRSLAESGQTWVIATLRSDFYHRLAAIPALVELKSGAGQYDLSPPDLSEIAQLVRRPAYAAGLRFEEDFETGDRLDDLLRDATAANRDSLPLLEFTLDELYRRRSGSVLTLKAYRELGGVEGALAQRAQDLFDALPQAAQDSLPRVFRELVAVGEGEADHPTRKQASLDAFGKGGEASPSRQLVDKFIEERLLTAKEGKGVPAVEVAHEALLTRWQPLVRWLAHDRELLRVRGRVERAAARWLQEGRRADLLLTAGKPLEEAEQLQASGFELEPEVEAMVEASRKKALRNRRLRQAAVASLTVLTLAAFGLAVVAQVQRKRADEGAQLAKKAKDETEQANKQLKKTNVDLDAARKSAVEARDDANRQLALSYIERGVNELEHGDRWRGFAILGQAYHAAHDANELRAGIRSLLGENDLALPRRLNHGSAVIAVAFSPDGTKLATASADNPAQLWNARTGEPIDAPMKHDGAGRAVAFNPDGTKIATLSPDQTARLWDASTGEPVGEPMKHDFQVHQLEFSPDGTKIATVSGSDIDTGEARVWDAATGKLIGEPIKDDGGVYTVVFRPDGTTIATVSSRQTARLWDVATDKPVGEPMKHDFQVHRLAFSPDGTKIATASGSDIDKSGEARVWNAATGKLIGEPVKDDGCVYSVTFSPDGATFATACGNFSFRPGISRLCDTTTGKPLGEPMMHEGIVLAVAFSPDGTKIATASGILETKVGEVRLWDAATGKPLGEPMKHDGIVYAVAFSSDGTKMATASGILETSAAAGEARIWDLAARKPLGQTMWHSGAVTAVAYDPDGSKIVTASYDLYAHLWDAVTGKPLGAAMKQDAQVLAVAFSPNGTKVATGTGTFHDGNPDTGEAELWDAATCERIGTPMKHDDRVVALAFSPDGAQLATASLDGTAHLWDAATSDPIGEPMKHNGYVNAVAFSADGRKLVTASGDGTARIWDPATRKPIGEPMKHDGGVNAVAVSPDGTKVATASADRTARLWDAATGKSIGAPMKHDRGVVVVAFSPDGKSIVTGSEDHTARLWDTATCKPLGETLRHDDVVNSVAFSPDGTKVATASGNFRAKTGEARLWDLSTFELLGEPLRHEGRVSAVVFSPDGMRIATVSWDKTAQLWRVARSVPDEPQWIDAYVTAVSQLREDIHHTFHSISNDEAAVDWREVIKSPAWLEYRTTTLDQSRLALHESDADRFETENNWFAAAFHLRWLSEHDPKNTEWQKRLANAKEHLVGARAKPENK